MQYGILCNTFARIKTQLHYKCTLWLLAQYQIYLANFNKKAPAFGVEVGFSSAFIQQHIVCSASETRKGMADFLGSEMPFFCNPHHFSLLLLLPTLCHFLPLPLDGFFFLSIPFSQFTSCQRDCKQIEVEKLCLTHNYQGSPTLPSTTVISPLYYLARAGEDVINNRLFTSPHVWERFIMRIHSVQQN